MPVQALWSLGHIRYGAHYDGDALLQRNHRCCLERSLPQDVQDSRTYGLFDLLLDRIARIDERRPGHQARGRYALHRANGER